MKWVKNLLSGCALVFVAFAVFITYTIWYTRPVYPAEIVGTWQSPRLTKEDYQDIDSAGPVESTYILNSDGTGTETDHKVGLDKMYATPYDKTSHKSIAWSITGSKFNLDRTASNWELSEDKKTLTLTDPMDSRFGVSTLKKQ